MRLYAGNLSYKLTEDELRDAFAAFGKVEGATIISDKRTGNSKGFGFVEMPDKAEAEKAIKELNGKDVGGRAIVVNEARPKVERDGPARM
jgi:RNA recognition motif-containing protein